MSSVTKARWWIPRRIGLSAATEIWRDRDLEAAIAMSIPALPRTLNQVGVPPRLDRGKHELVAILFVRFAGQPARPRRGRKSRDDGCRRDREAKRVANASLRGASDQRRSASSMCFGLRTVPD